MAVNSGINVNPDNGDEENIDLARSFAFLFFFPTKFYKSHFLLQRAYVVLSKLAIEKKIYRSLILSNNMCTSVQNNFYEKFQLYLLELRKQKKQ